MAKTIEFTLKGFKELQKDLKICAKEAIPYACRDTLNNAAFEARKLMQSEMAKVFTLRNQYTQRSVRVEKVDRSQRDIDKMQAKFGSIADYMDEQEQGGTLYGKDGRSYPVAVRPSPRRIVSRPNRKDKITLWAGRPKYGARRQRNAINIAHAARQTSKADRFIPFETSKGVMLAAVMGRRKILLKFLWDIRQKSIEIKPRKTLQPTMAEVERQMPQAMARAIVAQLRRRRILGY